jgi:transposase-like protein
MKNTARKKRLEEAASAQLTLADVINAGLHEFVIAAGTAALGVVLEHERTRVVGPRYAHLPIRNAHRSGSALGELVLGGRRVQVRRPRARRLDGREVELPSWRAFAAEDPLHERAVEQMLVGVSTRNYARSLEPVPDELVTRGTSKSAVSRRFVAATERQMAEWLGRDLRAIDLVVLMIDGVYVGDDHVLLVALGFDAQGNKHVLGVREGATENAASCTALLTDMRERGLRTDRAILAVIDGSKALAKAIRDVFGSRALIQRCQAHKSRNVTDQLPDELKPSVRQTLRDAYACDDAARAKRLIANLARRLRDEHPGRRRIARGGSRRDAHREAARPAAPTRASALDDERDREPDRLDAPDLGARETLAQRQDDPALDRRGDRRRSDALPPHHRRARGHDPARARAQGSRERAHGRCAAEAGRVVITPATATQFQQRAGVRQDKLTETCG